MEPSQGHSVEDGKAGTYDGTSQICRVLSHDFFKELRNKHTWGNQAIGLSHAIQDTLLHTQNLQVCMLSVFRLTYVTVSRSLPSP